MHRIVDFRILHNGKQIYNKYVAYTLDNINGIDVNDIIQKYKARLCTL